MKIFRQKQFVGIAEKSRKVGKTIKNFYHNNPTAYLTTVTAAASTSNLAMNAARKSQDKRYQDKQITAMKDLTNALSGVDKTLKETEIKTVKKKVEEPTSRGYNLRRLFSITNNDSMIKFRPKNFSILSSTLRGAAIGGNIGALSSPLLINKESRINVSEKANPIFRRSANVFNNSSGFQKRVLLTGASTLVGAALGALVGGIKELDNYISHKTTVDKRLMDRIVEDLKKTGFEEGVNFTRDPKTADRIKSPISVAITRNSGELRLLVNTIADKKLKDLTQQIIKNLPNSSAVTQEERNRYNEISITTISDGSADAGLIAGICEKFIRNKYPVYLVEVG